MSDLKRLKEVFMNIIKKMIKKAYNNRFVNIYTLLIIVFSIIVGIKFLERGYISGDDTMFHLANIIAKKNSIFNVIDKVLPEIANDFGYGIGLFYPRLPHVIGGIIYFIISKFGFGVFSAIKIIKILLIFFAAFNMYLLSSKLFNSNRVGVISSVLYITTGYFFVDIYQRDALNESFLFVFIPLVILGLYYLFVEQKYMKFHTCFIIGYVGMIYSHLVMSVWFTILLFPFLIINIKNILKKDTLKSLIIASIIILILTSTFTIPMIEHMIRGDYVIFNTKYGKKLWIFKFEEVFRPYLYKSSSNSYLYYNLPPLIIIFSAITIVRLLINNITKERKKFVIGFLIIGIIGVMMCSYGKFWHYIPQFLKAIQFGWRGALFVVFAFVLLASESIDKFLNCFKKKYVFIGSIVLLSLCLVTVNKHFKFVNTYETFETIDINNGMGWQREYLPQNTKDNIVYFNNRDNNILITDGEANVEILKDESPEMSFEMTEITNPVKIELPRLYYLGYKITNSAGKTIKYKENANGFIELEINRNDIYNVQYTGTILYKICAILKIITIIVLVTFIIKKLELFKKIKFRAKKIKFSKKNNYKKKKI